MILAVIPILMSILLKYKYKQINYIFILLISIGVMQGLCENIAFVTGANGVKWGPIKALIIIALFLIVTLNKSSLKTRLSNSFLLWSASVTSLYLIIAWHVFEAINNGQSINVFNVIQNYSLLNMIMALVVFFSYKEHITNLVVEMLVDIGKYVSIFAILQWILFKYYENNLLVAIASRGFGRLNAGEGGGIRVFSVFANHYGLSSFLTIITVLYVTRALYLSQNLKFMTLLLLVVAHVLTFNLTGIFLTFVGCFISYLINIYSCKKSVNYLIKTIKIASFVTCIVLIILMSFSDFRQRLYGITDYSEVSSGAGNSLFVRNQFIHNGINLFVSNLNGVGLSLTDTSQNTYDDLGFVRTGIVDNFSADAWFLWLIVQIGIFPGLLLLFVYIHPFLIGLLNLKTNSISAKWQICAFLSLLFIILLGSISNSEILNYPPSNILNWCAIGAIFAIASKNKILFKTAL